MAGAGAGQMWWRAQKELGASAGGDRENKVCTVQEKKKESGKKRGELNETEKKGGVRIGKMNDALFPDKFCRKGVQKGR